MARLLQSQDRSVESSRLPCDLDSSFFFSSQKPLPNDDFGSQLSGFCDFGRFAQFAVALQEGDGFLVCPQQFGQNERGFCNPPVSFQSLKR
jgi:hypothetical protein